MKFKTTVGAVWGGLFRSIPSVYRVVLVFRPGGNRRKAPARNKAYVSHVNLYSQSIIVLREGTSNYLRCLVANNALF